MYYRSRGRRSMGEKEGNINRNGLSKTVWLIIVANVLALLFMYNAVVSSCQNAYCPVVASQSVGGNIGKAPDGSCW